MNKNEKIILTKTQKDKYDKIQKVFKFLKYVMIFDFIVIGISVILNLLKIEGTSSIRLILFIASLSITGFVIILFIIFTFKLKKLLSNASQNN